MSAKSSALKKLAGETAIYGTSTIVARVLNFLLVPMYTRVFVDQAQYGVVTEFMAYIAVLQVLLVLGLETGCFRYASLAQQQNGGKGGEKVFSSALTTTGIFSLLFFLACFFWRGSIASALGYEGNLKCVVYVAGILLLDSVTAILFAKLRYEHRALKFALIKTVKICCELGFNLLFFLWAPGYFSSHAHALLARFIGPVPEFNYVLFSVFLSCVVCVLFFVPDLLRKATYGIDKTLWPKLMMYSLPLMIAGLPGILNDFSDRLLFRFLMPEEIFRTQMGIYQAGVKLAVLINLFIQMFRYAAEPFFFGESAKKDAKDTYAKVMNYFTAFCMLVYLGILLYIDLFELILGSSYREGVVVVPVMALAYVLLGIYFNASIWIKLSGKTGYAVLITSAGLLVTLAVNLLFMPRFGYMAAAWGHLASYLVMLVICVILGRKVYPVSYEWKKVVIYVFAGVVIYLVSTLFHHLPIVPRLALNTLLLGGYVLIWLRVERLYGTLRRLLQRR
ncbi:MAG: polysaccharide biosynthesis C-terminal domain-containing protein [Bacteroidales bacterium]|jgi:O-antigen/teichoic acid export membrane protein